MDFIVKLKKTLPYLLFPPFLLPLIITPSTLFPWHLGKTIYFQWWIMLVAVLALLVWWNAKKEGGVGVFGGHFVWKSLDLALIVFLVVYVLSAFLGENPTKSLWGDMARAQGAVVWCIFGVWYFLLRVLWQEEKYFWWGARAVGLVGVGVSLTALFQNFFQPYLGLDPSFLDSPRLSGTIGNPAFLAGYLLLASVITVGQCMREREWLWRGLLAGSAVIMLGTMVWGTQTRSTFLGLAVWGAVALVGLFFVHFNSRRVKFIAGGGAVVVTAVFLFIIFSGFQNTLSISLPRFVQFQSVLDPLSPENARLWAWGIGARAVIARPWLGWGPENFDYPFDLFYNPRFFTISSAETTWDKPHNFFIEVAVASGLVGVVAYVIFLMLLLLFFVRNVKSGSFGARSVWVVAGAGMTGYLVHTAFLFENSNTLLLFFFVSAFACGACANGSVVYSRAWWSALKPILAKSGAVVAVICFCFITLVLSSEMRVARALKSGRDSLQTLDVKTWREKVLYTVGVKSPYTFEALKFITGDLVDMQKNKILNKTIFEPVAPALIDAFGALEQRLEFASYVPYYAWRGHLLEIAGEFLNQRYFAQAQAAFARGHELSPLRQDVAYLLGKTHIFQNNFPQALQLHKTLYIQNPGLGEGPWFYGLALQLAGQEEQAIPYLHKGIFYGSRVASVQNIEFLGSLYAQRKKYDKMITLYEDVFVKTFPLDPLGYQRLAALYAQVGNKQKALEYIEKAVALKPSLETEATVFIKELSK